MHSAQKAASIVEEVGGSDESEVIENIKSRFLQMDPSANPTQAEDAARSITRSDYLYSFSASVAASIEASIKKNFRDNSSSFKLRSEYTHQVLQDHIQLCNDLNLDSRTTQDLIVFANRVAEAKYINPTELTSRIKYHVSIILKRGYVGGFTSLNNYQSFCNQMKNTFIQNCIDLGMDIDEFGKVEYVVKGSAVLSWKAGDDVTGVIGLPLKQADDIDAAMKMGSAAYNSFTKQLIDVVDDLDIDKIDIDKLKEQINYEAKIGKLQYDIIFDKFPIGNKSFTKKITDACQPFTNFTPDLKGKIKNRICCSVERRQV